MAASAFLTACGPPLNSARQERRQTIEGLTLSQSDDGRPAWTLHSRLARFLEDAKTASLDVPAMDFYREGRVVSRVTALSGQVKTDTRDVALSNSVVLNSFDDRSVLTTSALFYSSKAGRFHTPAAVVIRRPEGVIRGVGMEASPDLSEIRIFHQRSVLNGKVR